MRYGLPYKGSKNKIARWIIDQLPRGRRLVDLFAGGCAITHCAMLAGKWDSYLMVDTMDTPQLFLDAMDGRYRDEKRWISRDDFHRLKDTDAFVRTCWSFGNCCRTYLYSDAVAPMKKAMHMAILCNDWREFERLYPEYIDEADAALEGIEDYKARRLALCKVLNRHNPDQHIKAQHIEATERVQSLEGLASPGRIYTPIFQQSSYTQYMHQDGDVVYADPPYITKWKEHNPRYEGSYDKGAFCDWVKEQPYPIYISEYTMPDDFKCIGERPATQKFKASTSHRAEKLWLHEKWSDSWEQLELPFISDNTAP